MNSFTSIFFLILIVFSSCETLPSIEKNQILSIDNIPTNSFKIQGNKDTVLIGEKGIKLYIPANSFLDEKKQPYLQEINISLSEILTTEDIVLSDINTISSDGRVLEGNGMFRININQKNISISPKVKIRIAIPQSENSLASFFQGEIDENNQLFWTEILKLKNDSTNYWLKKGKEFLYSECRACHNINLISDMTGPALAWVSKRWNNMEELILYTKNPSALTEAGSLRAQYIRDWDSSEMTNCSLSTREIQAIYDYIDEECIIQGIDSTIYGLPESTKTYQKYIRKQDSLEQNKYIIYVMNGGWLIASSSYFGAYQFLGLKKWEKSLYYH